MSTPKTIRFLSVGTSPDRDDIMLTVGLDYLASRPLGQAKISEAEALTIIGDLSRAILTRRRSNPGRTLVEAAAVDTAPAPVVTALLDALRPRIPARGADDDVGFEEEQEAIENAKAYLARMKP